MNDEIIFKLNKTDYESFYEKNILNKVSSDLSQDQLILKKRIKNIDPSLEDDICIKVFLTLRNVAFSDPFNSYRNTSNKQIMIFGSIDLSDMCTIPFTDYPNILQNEKQVVLKYLDAFLNDSNSKIRELLLKEKIDLIYQINQKCLNLKRLNIITTNVY